MARTVRSSLRMRLMAGAVALSMRLGRPQASPRSSAIRGRAAMQSPRAASSSWRRARTREQHLLNDIVLNLPYVDALGDGQQFGAGLVTRPVSRRV